MPKRWAVALAITLAACVTGRAQGPDPGAGDRRRSEIAKTIERHHAR